MYAKLDNGRLIPANTKRVTYQGHTVFNPSPDVLTALGFKPVSYTQAPEPPEGKDAVPSWQETETEIVQVWTLVDRLPDPVSDMDEIVKILKGLD